MASVSLIKNNNVYFIIHTFHAHPTSPPGGLGFNAPRSGGSGFDAKGDAIVNQFLYDDRLLTMDELVSELGLPSAMPSESRRRMYLL